MLLTTGRTTHNMSMSNAVPTAVLTICEQEGSMTPRTLTLLRLARQHGTDLLIIALIGVVMLVALGMTGAIVHDVILAGGR
jgi:hypothetical protein